MSDRTKLRLLAAGSAGCLIALVLILFGTWLGQESGKAGYGGVSRFGCENTGRRSKGCEFQIDPVTIAAGTTATIWALPVPAPSTGEQLQLFVTLNAGALDACTGAGCNGWMTRRLICTWNAGTCLDATLDASDVLVGYQLPTVLADASAAIGADAGAGTITVSAACPSGGPPCSIGGSVSVNRIIAPALIPDSGVVDSSDAADAGSDSSDSSVADGSDAADAADSNVADANSGPAPTITGGYPLFVQAGGTKTILGTHFDNGTASTSFDGISVTPTVVSPGVLTYVVPTDSTYPNASCTGGLATLLHTTITTAGGTISSATQPADTYYWPPSPVIVPQVLFDPYVPTYTDGGQTGIVNAANLPGSAGQADCVMDAGLAPIVGNLPIGSGQPGFGFPSNQQCVDTYSDGGIFTLSQPWGVFAPAYATGTGVGFSYLMANRNSSTGQPTFNANISGGTKTVWQYGASTPGVCTTDGGVLIQTMHNVTVVMTGGASSYCMVDEQQPTYQPLGTNAYNAGFRFGARQDGNFDISTLDAGAGVQAFAILGGTAFNDAGTGASPVVTPLVGCISKQFATLSGSPDHN